MKKIAKSLQSTEHNMKHFCLIKTKKKRRRRSCAGKLLTLFDAIFLKFVSDELAPP